MRKSKEKGEAATAYGNKQCLKNKLKLVVSAPSPQGWVCVIKMFRNTNPYGLVSVF